MTPNWGHSVVIGGHWCTLGVIRGSLGVIRGSLGVIAWYSPTLQIRIFVLKIYLLGFSVNINIIYNKTKLS